MALVFKSKKAKLKNRKTKLTNKKTNFANNRPNCLKVTKHPQKVNLQIITVNGTKIKTSAREARTIKKYAA